MKPRVSVVIVNWNTREMLLRCLASLRDNASGVELEIIVVDNGSTDGSQQMVEAEFGAVKLLRNDSNLGFVRANNQGLKAAGGDFIFMFNSDAQVQAGCIERLVEIASSDPTVGAVGPQLLNSDGSYQISATLFPSVLSRFVPSVFERLYEARVIRPVLASQRPVAVGWLAGAALLFRRDVLERVGPLDERYFMWWDDVDWAQKLRRAGLSRIYVPDALAIHHARQSVRHLTSRELAAQLWDSEYLYLRLNSGRVGAAAVFALRFAKACLRQLLPAGRFDRDEARWRLWYHKSRFRRFVLAPLPPRNDLR